MSSKTKIVVLHMKEIIYTVIFAALALLLYPFAGILCSFQIKMNLKTASKKSNPGGLYL